MSPKRDVTSYWQWGLNQQLPWRRPLPPGSIIYENALWPYESNLTKGRVSSYFVQKIIKTSLLRPKNAVTWDEVIQRINHYDFNPKNAIEIEQNWSTLPDNFSTPTLCVQNCSFWYHGNTVSFCMNVVASVSGAYKHFLLQSVRTCDFVSFIFIHILVSFPYLPVISSTFFLTCCWRVFYWDVLILFRSQLAHPLIRA